MVDVERRASQSTYTNSDKPSTAFYVTGNTRLYASTLATRPGFFYIPVPPEIRAEDVVIESAEIVLTAESVFPGSRTATIQRHAATSGSNTYSKMTHANKPGVLAGSTGVPVTQAGTITEWVFDVTDDYAAIAAGGAYYGWRLITDDASPRPFRGAQASVGRPLLRITYSLISDVPGGLSPAGGAVSVQKPVFTWLGPDAQTAFRLQIDSVGGDFTSPDHDTGWVTSPLAQWDSSGSAWAGLANLGECDWRVAVRTAAGDTDYADPVTFNRVVKGTLTIVGPGATSGDPTPPTEWTFTGTQTAFQVTRLRPNGTVWADTGRLGGTDLAYTLGSGPTVDTGTATDRVRVWDDVDRVATPGDPVYAEDTQAWALDLDGGIGTIDSLTADQIDDSPRVRLQWTRAAGTPDEWLIVRDGEIVARIAGTEGHVGSTWTYYDWTSVPNAEHMWSVQPVVNDIAGAPAHDATYVPFAEGAWLVDVANDLWFTFDGSSMDMPLVETSTIYDPPGGETSIKRTLAVGGREGTAGGMMWDENGRTVGQMIEDLEAMRLNVNATYRLVWGRVNIPVVVRNMTHDVDYTWSNRDELPEVIRFEAYQTGEIATAEP